MLYYIFGNVFFVVIASYMRLTFKRDESGKVQEYVLKIYLNTQMTYLLALLGKGCLHLQTPRTQ